MSGYDYRMLDPARSVVVEACAGSGKTWTLVSRIVRLLLAGVEPGQILAITYTRKAAREIEERLRQWLLQLVLADDARVLAFLAERGLSGEAAQGLIGPARALFEQVAQARPALTINTFHGWFASLIGAAPLEAGLSGLTLSNQQSRLREEAWRALLRQCERDARLDASMRWLLCELGARACRELAFAMLDRRAEWEVYANACGGLDAVLTALPAQFGVSGDDPVCELASDAFWRAALQELARALPVGGKAHADMAAKLEQALSEPDVQAHVRAARAALFTTEGKPRAIRVTQALKAVDPDRVLSLAQGACERLARLDRALEDARACEVNRHALRVGAVLCEVAGRIKRSRQAMDYGDLEIQALRLMSDTGSGPFVQARLDARYRHILLDEFQDTNPLQWRVLMHWLEAYAPGQGQPALFVVGDPKQSIYRFRRADPQIFVQARRQFEQRFNALSVERDLSRRNAPAIIDVVNALFGAHPVFQGFRTHTTALVELPGRVQAWAPFGHDDESPGDPAPASPPLRNPLFTPVQVEDDRRRQREAETLCQQLKAMAGHEVVVQADGTARTAGFGDMMILLRRRTHLHVYEKALRDHGIPYFGASRGALLGTLEAQDLCALLAFLVSPSDDLALAHSLRSPLFACADEDLLKIAAERPARGRWWSVLRALPQVASSLVRARTLLAGWLSAAAHLPVHDLLDRVFHQGCLFERYAAQAPELAWPGVRANLEAFVELALKVDAGRFPSLPRFLDEIRRLRTRAPDEAPDEGLILGEEAARGRVRVLTVHAAKGLEAPIVWLVDAQGTPSAPGGVRVVMDWAPQAEAPTHFSLISERQQRGLVREALYAADAQAAQREEANLLYVALTRAKQIFVASGVANKRGADSGLSRLRDALRVLGAQDDGAALTWQRGRAPFTEGGSPPSVHAPYATAPRVGPVGRRLSEAMAAPGMDFGTALHAWLERLAAAEAPPLRPLDVGIEVWVQAEQAARRLLQSPSLRRFFDPLGLVWAANELEYLLPDGSVGRMDRVVEFDDSIWILDYKSGRPEEALLASYREQLSRYRDVMQSLRADKPVRCALLLTDGSLLDMN